MPIVTPVRGRLFVALLALAAALLLAAACSSSGGGGKTPAARETPTTGQTPVTSQTPAGATAEIKMIQGTKFDKSELRVPANTAVKITADNTDGYHALAVYESDAAADSGEDAIAEADPCSAPCKQVVEVTLSPGEHYFRCQIHHSMNGVVVAE